MKILVTGSQGAIGRRLVKVLQKAGHTLRTLDRAAASPESEWEHLPGDVRDISLVRRAAQGMDAVVHLAALLTDSPGEDLLYTVNIQGTWNVLMACVEAGVPRLVNFSSIQALGHSAPKHTGLYLPFDDQIPRQPAFPYQISKHVGEEMCTAFAVQRGLVVVSLRPTYVFQPDQERDRWWLRLPEEILARSATQDYWSFVDVRDVCQAVVLALAAPVTGHQAFLLTSDFTWARLPTAELAAKYYPHFAWPRVSLAEWVKDNPYRSLVDCTQAKAVLGWQPVWSRREVILGEEKEGE